MQQQKLINYYEPTTTAEIKKILGISQEELFFIRLEVGMNYCKIKYGQFEDLAWMNYAWWNWFLRVWESNDKRFIQIYSEMTQIGVQEYKNSHANLCSKYKWTELKSRYQPPVYNH